MLITAVQQSDLYVHIHSFFKIFFSIMVYNRIFLKRYMYFFFFYFILFIYLAALGLCCCVRAFSSCRKWGLLFVAVRGLSLVVVSGSYSSLQCAGFSSWWLLLGSVGSRRAGFCSCGTQAQ